MRSRRRGGVRDAFEFSRWRGHIAGLLSTAPIHGVLLDQDPPPSEPRSRSLRDGPPTRDRRTKSHVPPPGLGSGVQLPWFLSLRLLNRNRTNPLDRRSSNEPWQIPDQAQELSL